LRGVSLFLAPRAVRTVDGDCREKLQRQFDCDKLIWSELSMSQPLSRLGRTQDLEDIRALIRANRATLNLTEVREYFLLFDRAALLEEILSELK
jgi:hypothetical protein